VSKRPSLLAEIEPALFNYFADYAHEVREASKKKPPPQVPLGPLTVFIENFFGQFFRVALKTTISGFGSAAREKAVRARLKLEADSPKPEETILLISSYETYCGIHPDVEQERSVPDEDETAMEVQVTLLESFLPELLDRIEAWADASQESLVEPVQAAREHLEAAKADLGYE